MPDFRYLTSRPALIRSLALLALGAFSATGFQPLALWPVTILTLAVLIELLSRAASARQAFFTGWLFGVGHFTVGNYWIATAFTYQSEMPYWLGSIAVVLLSLYLAVFPALATLAAWLACTRIPKADQNRRERSLEWPGVALAAFWIVTEWMRAWVFTGFAWDPIGLALLGSYDTQGLALLSQYIGTYGVSGVAVLIAAWARNMVLVAIPAEAARRQALFAGGVTIAALLAALMHAPARYLDRQEGARAFTLVQPDLRQEVLDQQSLYEANFVKLAGLTVPDTDLARRIVFWPESGLADYLRDGYPAYLYRSMNYAADPEMARERIGRVIGPDSLLLTGAVDLVIEDDKAIAARNSVTMLDWDGNILAGYSKAHLVPYGEYLPLRGILEPLGLRRLVAGSLDFWPGPGPRSFDLGKWGEVGVQICYEIVFSGEVVDPRNRPDYIFNPSNDGWFGSWGPPQHLAQARMRAIEEGLPVMRATTTGISAVIDADGIVRSFIPRHTAGRIDGFIPPPHAPTPFARHGNALPLTFALVLFVFVAVALRRTKR